VVESVVVALRAVSYAAALQAAGVAMFGCIFDHQLQHSKQFVQQLVRRTALVALCLTIAYQLAEPARLLGRLDGVLDSALQVELLGSTFGTAVSIRSSGLIVIVLGSFRSWVFGPVMTIVGATIIAGSFSYSGHTSDSGLSWILGPTLVAHTLVVAFWLGALWPLYGVARREEPAVRGRIVESFSTAAMRLVPVIFVAGVFMSVALVPSLSSLRTPYGQLLVTKVIGFFALIVLAAVNRAYLGPALSYDKRRPVAAFRGVVLVEWAIIVAIVAATAVMTAFFSPRLHG
jgi:copper resistance protein D